MVNLKKSTLQALYIPAVHLRIWEGSPPPDPALLWIGASMSYSNELAAGLSTIIDSRESRVSRHYLALTLCSLALLHL